METNPVPASPRPLGQLLKDSFRLFQEGLPDYAAIVAASAIPSGLIVALGLQVSGLTDKAAITEALKDAASFGTLIPVAVAGVVSGLINAAGLIALVSAVAARNAGSALGVGAAYRRAVDLFVSFVWTELLMGLWILGGLILLIVPGIILAIRFSLSHLAVIIEGRSGGAALDRSKSLVAGFTGKVVGNLLAATIVVALCALIADTALNMVLILPKAMMPGGASFWGGQFEGLVHEVLGGVLRSWAVAFSILLFKDLAAFRDAHPAAA